MKLVEILLFLLTLIVSVILGVEIQNSFHIKKVSDVFEKAEIVIQK